MKNPNIAKRFTEAADSLQVKIDHAGRPMTQNPTPKRNREYQARMIEYRNLCRVQSALRLLAAGHEAGNLPVELAAIKTRNEIAGMVSKSSDCSKGGYYSCIEAADFMDKSPLARQLQAFIEPNRAERERLEQGRALDELQAEIRLMKIPSYFPTPAPIVSMMIDRARLEPGMMILEPSAGSGNIADAARDACARVIVHCVERHSKLRQVLQMKNHPLLGEDVMEVEFCGRYDRVLMNPPFENQQDIDHVRRAFEPLKPGGILVSVMSPSFEFRSNKKSADFRAWLESVGATVESLPDDAFKASGTSVSTRLVTIHKAASDPETELRATWDAQGVSKEKQAEILTDVERKSQPEFLASIFPPSSKPVQLSLF